MNSPVAELLFRDYHKNGVGASQWPSMFRIPAYDPVAIAFMGFGVLLVVGLALVF